MRKKVRAIAAWMVMAGGLSGCGGAIDTMKEGFAHSKAISTELEKSLGLKSQVGFNWVNGSLTSVSVNFQGAPANATVPEVIAKSKAAVVAEFKQTPKQIVVAFVVEP
jgi:hypothetical protein